MSDGVVLIVDDDVKLGEVLARICRRVAPTRVVTSYSEAMLALNSQQTWIGFIVDVRLGDGSGLDLVAVASHRFPSTPIAVISGDLAPSSVNKASELGAGFLCKPFDTKSLQPFLERVALANAEVGHPIDAEVALLAHRHQLSQREVEIVTWIARGGERDTFIASANISEATFKTHVRHLLQKCGATHLDELVADLLRNALASAQSGPR